MPTELNAGLQHGIWTEQCSEAWEQILPLSVTFQGASLSNSLNFLCLGFLSVSKRIKKWTELCMLSRFSHVQLSVTLWSVACQAPLSMGFSRQESWSGLPRPSPGDLPDSGIEPASLASPAMEARTTWEAPHRTVVGINGSCSILCYKYVRSSYKNQALQHPNVMLWTFSDWQVSTVTFLGVAV